MISNWETLDPKEKMIGLLNTMKTDYHRARQMDNISDVIEIRKVVSDRSYSKDFFWIAIHSSIPYNYLTDDIPVIGMEMMGRSISSGENKALVERVSKICSPVSLNEVNFVDLLNEAHKSIPSIGAIFLPIRFMSQFLGIWRKGYGVDSIGLNYIEQHGKRINPVNRAI